MTNSRLPVVNYSCAIAGDLYVVESCNLHLRYAQVRDGNLLLYRYLGQNKELDIRIPLYNLSINLGFSTQNGRFSLTRYSDLTPLATFQVSFNFFPQVRVKYIVYYGTNLVYFVPRKQYQLKVGIGPRLIYRSPFHNC